MKACHVPAIPGKSEDILLLHNVEEEWLVIIVVRLRENSKVLGMKICD